MTAAIGIFYRTGGVWKRVDPPSVRVSGAWKEMVRTYVKVSGVWKTCWTNIANDLSLVGATAWSFDISPYSVSAGHRFNSDGTVDRIAWPGTYQFWTEVDNWLDYDNGREYEIYFDHILYAHADTEPTLDTWLNLTEPPTNHTISDSESGVGYYQKRTRYLVKIREKVGAGAGDDSGTFNTTLEAEV